MEVRRTIDGVIYIARYRGVSYANKIAEYDVTHQFDLAGVLFREVLISPKVDIDDFSNVGTFSRVFEFLLDTATGNFTKKTHAQIKQQARNNMGCWRLIFSDMSNLDYNTVFNQMTPEEIEEANAALDMIMIEIKKKNKK